MHPKATPSIAPTALERAGTALREDDSDLGRRLARIYMRILAWPIETKEPPSEESSGLADVNFGGDDVPQIITASS